MAEGDGKIYRTFKEDVMAGVHDLDTGGDTLQVILVTGYVPDTVADNVYADVTASEVSGTGYTAGGQALTNVDPTTSGTTAFTDFADETWTTASITARGALIYNSTPNTTSIALTNPAVVVLDFGADKTSTAGDFTVVFPTADASNAIIRIA